MMSSILESLIDKAFGVGAPTALRGGLRPQAKVGPQSQSPGSGPRDSNVSSGYGTRIDPITHKGTKFHAGVDIRGKVGDPVYAIDAGTVKSVRDSSSAGHYIVIMHKDNLTSSYMHLSQSSVKPGQVVVAGERIGAVGATGNVTGPHLHLEVRLNDVHQRPTKEQAAIASGKAITGEV
jgi:murein DD-endopeptidase MepM/ murein hydrolase activator NlpD